MNLQQAENLALKLMDQNGLIPKWSFRFDRAKVRFGCCNFTKREISLSKSLTQLNDKTKVYDTILHEIAHALVGPFEGHGKKWKQKIMELGGDPRARYHHTEVVIPPRKYTTHCPSCGKTAQAQRKRKVACKLCCQKFNNGQYSEKFRIQFIEN
jgi:predicted SprT family Zn-dependent metalloprotease